MDLSGLKFDLDGLNGGCLTYPDKLDSENETDGKCSIKFTFDSFSDYAPHEKELKEYAEQVGAIFSVAKV